MRFKLFCVSAPKFPMVIEATATAATTISHSGRTGQNAVQNSRSSSAKLAAFDATLIEAVIDVGAPSYTSGAHMWNGTAAILKNNPAETVTSESSTSTSPGGRVANACAMRTRFVDPAIPYINENP